MDSFADTFGREEVNSLDSVLIMANREQQKKLSDILSMYNISNLMILHSGPL